MLSCLMSLLASGLLAAPVLDSPPGLGVEFIDVGQGAAALLRSADRAVLIDAGPTSGAEAVARALVEHGVERLDLFVATHFDADHIGGLGPILVGPDARWGTEDDIGIDLVWDRGLDSPLPQSDALGLYLGLVGAVRVEPEPGDRFEAAGLRIERLSGGVVSTAENDRGLVLCVEFEGMRMLLPGDVSAPVLEAAAQACGPVDLFWASHHGSADALSPLALERLDPAMTVISAGLDNPHCHPAPATLALLHRHPTWVLQAAGLWPHEACSAVAASLASEHRIVGGSLWIEAPSQAAWAHSGGLWARSS